MKNQLCTRIAWDSPLLCVCVCVYNLVYNDQMIKLEGLLGEWWTDDPSFVVARILKLLKEDLKIWTGKVFGNVAIQKDCIINKIKKSDDKEATLGISEKEV